MDGDVRRLVVDVTDVGDKRDVACAFVRRDYAFEGISKEDIEGTTIYPSRPSLYAQFFLSDDNMSSTGSKWFVSGKPQWIRRSLLGVL